ncbi:MAG: hypothetical protein NVSMB37_3860 [Candidatus Saccharimonadales bacterium]
MILLAVIAAYLMKDSTYNLTISHLVSDNLATKTTGVFVPATHGLYDINIRWVVVATMIISAIVPLFWALRWKKQYEINVATAVMPQRWIDFSVTSAIIVATIAVMSGVHDVMSLVLIGGLMVTTCFLAWLADKQNRLAIKTDWTAYAIGLLTGSLPWILIAATAFATYFYGMIRSPWYVYALYGVSLVGFSMVALNQKLHYSKANQWRYEIVERNYIFINIFIKASFAIILIVGLYH